MKVIESKVEIILRIYQIILTELPQLRNVSLGEDTKSLVQASKP